MHALFFREAHDPPPSQKGPAPMLRVYSAALCHDVPSVMHRAPQELIDSIAVWRKEMVSHHQLAILIKTAVLNDPMARHVPGLLQLYVLDADAFEHKPSLVHMYAALLETDCPEHLLKRAMKRAGVMSEPHILQHATNATDFVKQLSNRDDHKKRR